MDPSPSPLSLSQSGVFALPTEQEIALYTEMADHPSYMEIQDDEVENRLKEIHGIGCYILHSSIPSYAILSIKSVEGRIEQICFKLSETVQEVEGNEEKYPTIEKAIAKRIQGLVAVKEIEASNIQKTVGAITQCRYFCDFSQNEAEIRLKGRLPGTFLINPGYEDNSFHLNCVQENGIISYFLLTVDRHGFIKCGPHIANSLDPLIQALSMCRIPYHQNITRNDLIGILQKTNSFILDCDQSTAEEKLLRLSEEELSCFLLRLDPESERGCILSYISEDGVHHAKFLYNEKKEEFVSLVTCEEDDNPDNLDGYKSIEDLIRDYTKAALVPIHDAKKMKVLGLNCDNTNQEYDSLPGLNQATMQALEMLFGNKKGNRWGNIFPFPENMVHLKSGKYINASRVKPEGGDAYICTQGPLCDQKRNTLNEFWEMVWQEDVPVIVMVTNTFEKHKEKCAQYWPAKGSYAYGDITVDLIEEQIRYGRECTQTSEGLTLRTFKLQRNQQTKIVHQLKFENWPDFGSGNVQLVSQMIDDANTLRTKMNASDKPLLVHCSAGVGRSGTFIAEHHLAQLIETSLAKGHAPQVNVRDTVIALRDEKTGRMGLVQSPEQYKHIYQVLCFRYKGNV